jgi:peptide/nickel transport system ATP-binding protein
MGPLLELHELGVRLRGEGDSLRIVSGLNLELQRGECVALTGRSGCGKTSACLAPFGLLDRRLEMTGVARFAGHPASNGPAQAGTERVAFVLQEPGNNFAPHLRIDSQITDLYHYSSPEKVHQWCAELGLGDSARLLQQYPNQCSGGELQRLALVAALAQDPALLVADEPTAALDSATRDAWCRLVRRQCEQGLAVLLVTHDPAVLAAIAHRQIPVGDALVPAAGPTPLAKKFVLSGSDRLLAVRLAQPVGVQTLSNGEGTGIALGAGQSLCVTGPSGAGKSSLLRLVLGLPSPWNGAVEWLGQNLRPWPHESRKQLGSAMGAVLQDARGSLNPNRTVLDAVSAGFRRSGNSWRAAQQRAAEELVALGVPAECWLRTPTELSVGQAQRVALAQALAHTLPQVLARQPALLVLDEPTGAQDRDHRQLIIDRLAVAQHQHGAALLVATHDVELVAALGGQTLPLLPADHTPTV